MLDSQTKSISNRLDGCSLAELINNLASWATSNNLPFVVYRLPHEDHFQFQIGHSITQVDDNDLSGLDSGFLFSSYEGENYFINNGLSINSKNKQLLINSSWPADISLESFGEEEEKWHPYIIDNNVPETKAEEYIGNVERCIDEIKISKLIKVVPSRTKRIKLATHQNLSDIFIKLCEAYSNAFISILSTPDTGTWIGATPETLIEVDDKGIFKTMSLAGTQAYNGDEPLHTLPWTQKEIEEQLVDTLLIASKK